MYGMNNNIPIILEQQIRISQLFLKDHLTLKAAENFILKYIKIDFFLLYFRSNKCKRLFS